MADQEKRELDVENLEATELEDTDLEDVSGGLFREAQEVTNNTGCPTTNNSCN